METIVVQGGIRQTPRLNELPYGPFRPVKNGLVNRPVSVGVDARARGSAYRFPGSYPHTAMLQGMRIRGGFFEVIAAPALHSQRGFFLTIMFQKLAFGYNHVTFGWFCRMNLTTSGGSMRVQE